MTPLIESLGEKNRRRRAHLRFYAELNDFLPADRRSADLEREFDVSPSVKDMIEAAGVPHTEIDLVVVNGESVDFSYRVQDGDHISVYPVFESFDIEDVVRVRPSPLRETRFVVDVNLGGLARYLRLLGFDSEYGNDLADEELVEISRRERRILLTRDVDLLKRKALTHGYFVRATDVQGQAVEVVKRLDLFQKIRPFVRCMSCNAELLPVPKEQIEDRLEERTRLLYNEFRICPGCDRLYWHGSHHAKLMRFIEMVRNQAV
jgi:uncharacterized protein